MGCTCRDRALAAISNARLSVAFGQLILRLRDGIGAAYGQAFNLGSLAVFQGESTVVLDGTSGCLSATSIGNGVVIRGIGVHARQLKLHRKVGVCVRGQALVGFNHLGNLHAAGGAHGQLAVVAKVQHTHTTALVRVPLEVNAAIGGAGYVLSLIDQLAIDGGGGGQADFFGARIDVVFAIIFFSNATLDFFLSCNANGHIVGLGKRFTRGVRVLIQVVQLIVIGLIRFYSCGRLILAFSNFGKQRGILGMIVEAIACCRGKGSRGLADGFAICRY